MSILGLALCMSVLAFLAVSTAVSAAAVTLAGLFESRLARLPSRSRARAFLWLRLAPTAAGLMFVSLFFLPAFLLLEPADAGEEVGPKMLVVALFGALLLLRCGREASASWKATRGRVAAWLADARPLALRRSLPCPAYVVRAPFPVVAVVGIWRPFMVVSRAVLDACSEPELAAILEHEAAHLRHRDNLKRLLTAIVPDLMAWTPASRQLELGWQQAAEEVADDSAGPERALDLAAALLKVARLAHGSVMPPAAVAAFCQGGDIARRVIRLTSPRSATDTRDPALVAGVALAVTASTALMFGALHHVHAVTEVVVTFLQ